MGLGDIEVITSYIKWSTATVMNFGQIDLWYLEVYFIGRVAEVHTDIRS